MRTRNDVKARERAEMLERIKKRAADKPPAMSSVSDDDWAATPPAAREFIWRRMLELRDGYAKLRGLPKGALDDDQAFQDEQAAIEKDRALLKIAEQIAATRGLALPDQLLVWTTAEDQLREDPIDGLRMLCRMYGQDPVMVARELLARYPHEAPAYAH